jgi:hypothetical protein
MSVYFGLDTGSTRNASALVGVHEERRVWTVIAAAKEQGSSERPNDHRNVVGPRFARIVKSFGGDEWEIDSIESGPIRLVSQDFGLSWKFQGGDLATVYGHGRAVIHSERLQFADDLDPVYVAELKKGLARIQAEHNGGKVKVWLPEEGASHFDLTSAFLRAMDLGKAGDETPAAKATTFGATSYAPHRGAGWYPTPEY